MPPIPLFRPRFANCWLAGRICFSTRPGPANGLMPSAFRRPARLAAPVPDPQKIICLGRQLPRSCGRDQFPHSHRADPFSKYATAIIGAGDAIVLPAVSNEVDFEAELVIVVGKRGRHSPSTPPWPRCRLHVGHDVSARDWQLKKDGKQWMVGKTFDTFAPVGPELVHGRRSADPQNRIHFGSTARSCRIPTPGK